MYYIVKNTEGKQGHWGGYSTKAKATTAAKNFNFDTVIVQSDKDPKRLLFEKVNNVWIDTERELSPKEIKALQNWEGLEDALELTELADSPSETFFIRALSTTNANAYSLLMNCFGTNKWDKRLHPALQMVKDSLPVQLTASELTQLNTILSDNGFNITIV